MSTPTAASTMETGNLPGAERQALLAAMPVALAVLDADLHIRYANPYLCQQLGLDCGALEGRNLTALVAPRPGEPEEYIRFPIAQRCRYIITGDGRRQRIEATRTALPDTADSGLSLWLVHDASIFDEAALRGLEVSDKGFALALRAASDGIWGWDPVTKNLFLSPRLLAILGYPEDFRVQTTDDWLELVHPDDLARYSEANSRHLNQETPHFECEYRIRRADGTWAWGLSRGMAWFDDDGIARRMAGSITDISERKRQEEHIQFLATRDSLTSLANRLHLAERLVEALHRASQLESPLAVIYLDLDNFKDINDSLGHQVGDQVLIEIGRRLALLFPAPDLVARQGGDEFILVITRQADQPATAQRVSLLLETIRQPITLENLELAVGASAGIAFFPQDGENANALLQNADLALYAAKAGGRGRYALFSKDMGEQARQRIIIERELTHAIHRQEFSLDYQAQVSLQDGRITGCEALARWRHPQLGQVGPACFIPIAESSGLILPLGTWIINQACRQAADWLAKGFTLPVAVNVSVAQLLRSDFLHTVRSALEESGLPPHLLELELTESLLMEGGSAARATLDALADLGVTLSIDDFGTGYSSLAYLRRFAADKLKIDQSFVRGIADDPNDAAIVRALIELAHKLRLETIAEGIETLEQSRTMRQLGCGFAQGYLFGRPMPPAAFFDFLAAQGGPLPPPRSPRSPPRGS